MDLKTNTQEYQTRRCVMGWDTQVEGEEQKKSIWCKKTYIMIYLHLSGMDQNHDYYVVDTLLIDDLIKSEDHKAKKDLLILSKQ